MSYLNAQASNATRTKALIGVGAFHAVLGVGLITGLAVNGEFPLPEAIIEATNFPIDVPTPEPTTLPEVIEDAKIEPNSEVTAPESQFNLTQTSQTALEVDDTIIDEVIRIPTPTPLPTTIPRPTPTPSYSPTAPSPRGNAGGWITTNDYPTSEIRGEHEGTASYRLIIGSNGRVDNCEITAGSGRSKLDRATCRLLKRRARFNPATNGNGTDIVGTYTGSVTWQLPE